MAGNTFGKLLRVTTFGESHGIAMGCIIDGCPAGLKLSVNDITVEVNKRRSSDEHGSRLETDTPQILSGIFEGKTLGSPIAIIFQNTGQNSADYDNLKDIYRPAHADFSWEAKYGFRDHRGGGRSSGRETLCRVAAGAVAKKLLSLHGITISAFAEESKFNIEELRREKDSSGGIISCRIGTASEELPCGLPAGLAGLGEPVFDKLNARLASAIMSIGGCRGIEFGAGFAVSQMKGSEHNQLSDGILGGISTGQEIFFRAAFKPVPSIGKPQKALDKNGNVKEIEIKGRHDICIVPRAVPVVEAMTALVFADFLLLSRCSKI